MWEVKSRSGSNKIKLKLFKSRVNETLWFAKSLELTEMKATDKLGRSFDIIDKPRSALGFYESLSELEKGNVKSLLHILDTFGISDEAYHKIAVHKIL